MSAAQSPLPLGAAEIPVVQKEVGCLEALTSINNGVANGLDTMSLPGSQYRERIVFPVEPIMRVDPTRTSSPSWSGSIIFCRRASYRRLQMPQAVELALNVVIL